MERALWCHPTSALPSLPVVTEARAPWNPLRVGSVLPVAFSSPPWGGTNRAFVIRPPQAVLKEATELDKAAPGQG